MGAPWIDKPILWHSSRVRGAFDPALNEDDIALITSKFHSWYRADWDFGQTTIEFFCAGIALAAVFNGFLRIRTRRASPATSTPGIVDRTVAALRFTAARQYHIPLVQWYSPPLAAIIGVAGTFLFINGLMLAVKPYYWAKMAMGHSAPIATRSGWLSLGIMPFMIAFATKVNFIGILTGTSHEKLQVFHRWSALIMYITSLVHTFPFIVGEIAAGTMVSSWNTSSLYWTGVAALVPQTYLVFLSWGVFRNRYYEIFKKLHFIAAAIFMAALFLHVDFILTSWDYFWGTAALYALTWIIRVGRTHLNSGLGLAAEVQSLPDQMVKVTVQVPNRLKWTPGQHVFVRFLVGMHTFSSHPFTIVSNDGNLELVFRVHGGVTKTLAERASGKPAMQTRVLIDGPYGGLPLPLKNFDHICLFAGGSGATFTLSILRELVHGFKQGMQCKHVDFVLAAKHHDSWTWLEEALVEMRQLADESQLKIQIHITQDDVCSKEDSSSEKSSSSCDVVSGRPNFSGLVHEACRAGSGRVAVVACGPESLVYDVRNAVAECELVLFDGYSSCKDIFLHTESYSW
ncbi:ferric reductase NAD binding domain-containing protein [Mycena floridula]|nr:ferric reductase NAD binding domain-containing protein [Mycena floridula]